MVHAENARQIQTIRDYYYPPLPAIPRYEPTREVSVQVVVVAVGIVARPFPPLSEAHPDQYMSLESLDREDG